MSLSQQISAESFLKRLVFSRNSIYHQKDRLFIIRKNPFFGSQLSKQSKKLHWYLQFLDPSLIEALPGQVVAADGVINFYGKSKFTNILRFQTRKEAVTFAILHCQSVYKKPIDSTLQKNFCSAYALPGGVFLLACNKCEKGMWEIQCQKTRSNQKLKDRKQFKAWLINNGLYSKKYPSRLQAIQAFLNCYYHPDNQTQFVWMEKQNMQKT